MPTSAERAAARREQKAEPAPPPAAGNDSDLTSLSRDEAAAWFAQLGFKVMTAERLRQDAAKKKGPPFFTIGRVPYYRRVDLEAWLRDLMRDTRRGTQTPRG